MAEAIKAKETELARLEQHLIRELLRIAELDAARTLSPAAFHAATVEMRACLRKHSALIETIHVLAWECEKPGDQKAAMDLVSFHQAENRTLANSLRELTVRVHASRAVHEESERQALLDEQRFNSEAAAEGRSGLRARSSAKAAKDLTESLR